MRVTTRSIADRIDSESHERATDAVNDDAALIEQGELDRYYRVLLPDSSQGPHDTMIAIDRWGHLQADCHCAHITHGEGLCAHILTLLLARERGITTVNGQPIEPANRYDNGEDFDIGQNKNDTQIAEIETDPKDFASESVAADGGIDLDEKFG